MRVSPGNFTPIFGNLGGYLTERIIDYKFAHRAATTAEHDAAVLDMINAVYHNELPVSGPARHPIWEKGWAENLAAFDPAKAGRALAKPHYYNKYPIVRWNGDLYVPESEDYEHNMLAVIQDWVFDRYLRRMKTVIEFGCGTGHNLFRVRDANPDAVLVGCDWADSAVKFVQLQADAGAYGLGKAFARKFDFFNPELDAPMHDPYTAFLTVAALEQVGTNWKPFFDFCLRVKPRLVVHIEPIAEVLDDKVLLDHLSLGYFRKRGYLSGWLTHLQTAECLGKAGILNITRTRIGSKFIEGYTVVIWSPWPVVKA